jgi:hypothetical protein
MGVPVTHWSIAPLNLRQALFLQAYVWFQGWRLHPQTRGKVPRIECYDELVASREVIRRALDEYRRRPWRTRWLGPRPPQSGELSFTAWKAHTRAFLIAHLPERQTRA